MTKKPRRAPQSVTVSDPRSATTWFVSLHPDDDEILICELNGSVILTIPLSAAADIGFAMQKLYVEGNK